MVGTDRAIRFRMCEACLALADADFQKHTMKKTRAISKLPVLFFGDLKVISQRINSPKELAHFLGIAPVTLRLLLKVNKGRKRLPGWVVRRIYEPLWGPHSRQWLAILPTRVFLVAASVRRRRFRNAPSPGALSISAAECL